VEAHGLSIHEALGSIPSPERLFHTVLKSLLYLKYCIRVEKRQAEEDFR
jgi:hypothetical protein